MKGLCIYHGGCTDGVASAWAVDIVRPEWQFFPGVYQQEPPWDLIEAASEVVFVDFTYKRPVMEEIVAKIPVAEGFSGPPRVTVLDHHKTAEADLVPLLQTGRVQGVFNMDMCGALIAWNWFHSDEPPPALLNRIDAFDRFQKDSEFWSDEIRMAVRSYPHSAEVAGSWPALMDAWNALMDMSEDALVAEGTAIHRYYRQICEDVKREARTVEFGGYNLPTANCTYHFASDVAGELAERSEHGLAACWFIKGDGSVYFSVRSRGDIDAGKWCTQFGGGGHPGAAGFTLRMPRR